MSSFRFQNLLIDYFQQQEKTQQSEVEETIWQEYGVEGAVMIMDMSGFSLVTQRYGIVYYLSMIRRMQLITQPIIEKYDGEVVKFVADNVFARFPKPEQAIQAAIDINKALNIENDRTPDIWDIKVATGIDYGRYLYTDEQDYFGDVVNCSSKLGEDIASGGEILVTKNAVDNLPEEVTFASEHVEFTISGITLDAYSIEIK